VVEFIANVIAFFYNLYHKLVGGSIVPDMMGDIEDAVRGGLDKVLEFFSTILTNVWTKVEEIFGNIWSSITTWFATNVGEWQAKWEEFREKAREALSTLWEIVQEKLDEIPTRAAAAVQGIKDWFQGLGEGFIEALKTGFDNAKEALFETLTGIFNDLLKKAQPILDLLDKVGVKIEVPVIPSGGTSTNTPSATGFASGGIVTRPMLGMIAEGGESEAIIPLSRLPSMFNAIAGAGAGAGLGAPTIEININNPTVRSDDDIRRLTALIKDEISKEITNALRFGGSLR
jgi:phage-related protein